MPPEIREIEEAKSFRASVRAVAMAIVTIAIGMQSCTYFDNKSNREHAVNLAKEEATTEQEAIKAGYPPEWIYCMFHKKEECVVVNGRGRDSGDTSNNPGGSLPMEKTKE